MRKVSCAMASDGPAEIDVGPEWLPWLIEILDAAGTSAQTGRTVTLKPLAP